MAEQGDPEPVAAQPLHHVATVDEAQLEQANGPAAADGERTRIEAPHEAAPDAEDDDKADPKPHPNVAHSQRPRRQEHELRVISWRGPARRRRDDMESPLRAGREPEPPRT